MNDKKDNKIQARLIRGRVYMLAGKTFRRGVWTDVTAQERDYLDGNAVDPVTVQSGGEKWQEIESKFEFREVPETTPDESENDAPAFPRKRERKPMKSGAGAKPKKNDLEVY